MPPAPLPGAIARPRLDAQLDRWAAYRLVLVRAAAGYGKTSLVSIWAGQQPPAALGWLSLDSSDADPVQFVRYFAAALDRLFPGLLDIIDPILQDTEPNPQLAMSSLLAGMATDPAAPILFVLDDYHRVQSAEVDALVSLALERAPHHLHFMILTRDLPALPLARLMVTGSLLELTGNDLRLDQEEMARFLQTLQLPPLSEQQVKAIMSRSEGWVAGLKMAGLSLADRSDPTQFLEQLHGASQWQANYLAGEVLAQQTPEMRRFLLQTSILERLSGQLCEAVTGMPEAPRLLAAAFSAGLFLVPLDGRGIWYRYHHLFQEMLQLRLAESSSQAEIQELHRRAAAWFEAERDEVAAIDHYLAAGAIPPAVGLLERVVRRALAAYDLHTADVLLRRLPDDILDQQPGLLILQAWLHFLIVDTVLIASTERAERAFGQLAADAPGRLAMEAELAVNQAASAFMQRRLDVVVERLGRATELIDLLDDGHKAAMQTVQFQHALQQGQWEKAERFARQAIATATRANYWAGVISQQTEMSLMLLYTGRGAAAAQELAEVIAAYPSPQPNYVLRVLQYTHLEAAEVNYWLNNLESMRQYARSAAEIGAYLEADLSVTIAAQLLDLHNLANPEQAVLDYARPRVLARQSNGMFPFSSALETVYQLRVGNVQNALLLVETWAISPDSDPTTLTPERLTSYVATRVALGDDLQALEEMVSRGLAHLERSGFMLHLGRLQAIEAHRRLKLGDRPAAIQALATAVETVARTGLVRAILDVPALGPLLAEIRHPRAAMLAMQMEAPPNELAIDLSSLTPTELRILRLLSQDMKYTDVADALTISINTVQSHVTSLYRKLRVNRRMAAIEIAQQAGLLD